MRRLSLVLFLVAVVAVAANAIELNGMKQPGCVPVGTFEAYLDSALSPQGLATAYTFYGQDASDAFQIKLYRAGVADSLWVDIPAGKSLLVPAPAVTYHAASGYYVHRVGFQAHADTVFYLPWVR